MGPPLANYGEGGSRPEYVRAILCCSCVGNNALQVRNLGGDTPYRVDPGGVPPTGGAANHEEPPKEMAGWGLGIPLRRGSSKGGVDLRVGGIN